jgi:hypothetical protein
MFRMIRGTNSITQLACTTRKQRVSCEVGTELLNIVLRGILVSEYCYRSDLSPAVLQRFTGSDLGVTWEQVTALLTSRCLGHDR